MNKIKELRKEMGLTQTQLAVKANFTLRGVQRIENGEINILDCKLRTVKNIAEVFNKKIEDLL